MKFIPMVSLFCLLASAQDTPDARALLRSFAYTARNVSEDRRLESGKIAHRVHWKAG
jgi:hypothetical protein